MVKESGMRVVDCFCASGGLTCGLKAAGFDVAMGIDVDRSVQVIIKSGQDAQLLDHRA